MWCEAVGWPPDAKNALYRARRFNVESIDFSAREMS
jgi:hypothetical protein